MAIKDRGFLKSKNMEQHGPKVFTKHLELKLNMQQQKKSALPWMWDQTDHGQNEELYSSYQHQNHPAKLAEE